MMEFLGKKNQTLKIKGIKDIKTCFEKLTFFVNFWRKIQVGLILTGKMHGIRKKLLFFDSDDLFVTYLRFHFELSKNQSHPFGLILA